MGELDLTQMSARRTRKYKRRPSGDRRYKRRFLLATEGKVTEPEYFSLIKSFSSEVSIESVKKKHSENSPLRVLEAMEEHLKKEPLLRSDEAWLVVDRDSWPITDLDKLLEWATKRKNYGVALSNPNFEYWLLHCEDSKGVTTATQCSQKPKKHWPDYRKTPPQSKITESAVKMAIDRARNQHSHTCNSWPQSTGTTMHRLMESMLATNRTQTMPKE